MTILAEVAVGFGHDIARITLNHGRIERTTGIVPSLIRRLKYEDKRWLVGDALALHTTLLNRINRPGQHLVVSRAQLERLPFGTAQNVAESRVCSSRDSPACPAVLAINANDDED